MPSSSCSLIITVKLQVSQDSIVCIVTRLWPGQSGVRVLAGARYLSLFQIVQMGCGAHLACCSVGTRVLSPG